MIYIAGAAEAIPHSILSLNIFSYLQAKCNGLLLEHITLQERLYQALRSALPRLGGGWGFCLLAVV